MAKSSLHSSVVVLLLTFVVYQSTSYDLGSSDIELNIEIAEELPTGTSVADLAADSGLDTDGDQLMFYISSGSFYEYFVIGGDTAAAGTGSRDSGHLLIVNRTMDRDVICRHRSAPASLH